MKQQGNFDKFIENIELGTKQTDRFDSAIGSLTDFISDTYNIPKVDIFVQGSYANGTAVKPAPSLKDGEYDVDLVAMTADQGNSADGVFNDLENSLKSHGFYSSIIDDSSPTAPCVRLRYADDEVGGFHVDLVPARMCMTAPIEIPMRDNTWRESAPKEYTQWCKDQGDDFARLVKIFKRWRDENQNVSKAVKSILLQVLTANNLVIDTESDAISFTSTLIGIEDFLLEHEDTVPMINNPVLESENLSDRWELQDYVDFKECLMEAVGIAKQALDEQDNKHSSELWRQLFGESFPTDEDKVIDIASAKIKLGPILHQEAPEDMWQMDLKYYVNVAAEYEGYFEKIIHFARKPYNKTLKIPVRRKPFQLGTVLNKHLDLYYDISTNAPGPYDIYWQVVNTGKDVLSLKEARGDIDIEKISTPHKESSLYAGIHWIECFIVKNNVCVARSGQFFIEII